MKQKIDKPITEAVLDKVLDKGFKEFKQELEKDFQQVVQDISDFQESKWEEQDEKWMKNDEKFEKFSVTQDKILKILEDWQVENEVGTDQSRRLKLDVDNHERLKVLERKN